MNPGSNYVTIFVGMLMINILTLKLILKCNFTFSIANWDLLQYQFSCAKPISGKLYDIQGGELYHQLSQLSGFLSIPEHTGLILCADGVPVFKSSSGQLWPFYLSVTSFPLEIRMKAENLLLAGVWFGP